MSVSAAQIGENIGLSQAACWRRIQRLEYAGFKNDVLLT